MPSWLWGPAVDKRMAEGDDDICVNHPTFSGTVLILNTSCRCPAKLHYCNEFHVSYIQPNSAREFCVVLRWLNEREH